jgi:hypothetical protein
MAVRAVLHDAELRGLGDDPDRSDFQADAELARLVPAIKFMKQEYRRGPTLVEIAKTRASEPVPFPSAVYGADGTDARSIICWSVRSRMPRRSFFSARRTWRRSRRTAGSRIRATFTESLSSRRRD